MSNQYIKAILEAPDQLPERNFSSQAHSHFDDVGELNKIAEGYCLVGRFEEACALYKRMIELNPAWIDLLDVYARALWTLHSYEEAKIMWALFLDKRTSIYQKIGIPLNFYTIDDVFTSAFGNFTHYYPMDKYGYLSNEDEFYYHSTPLSDGRRSTAPVHGKSVCNEALRDCVFERIGRYIPRDISSLLLQDDYVTRLPFYCGTDLNRQPTHFHHAFAEKMLRLCKTGAAARIRFASEQIEDCELRLARMGIDSNRPLVCIHVRESGYWGRTGDPTHSTKNADIMSYIPAVEFLTENGYQVVRLGDPSMRSLPELRSVFDYALSEYKNDFLDLYLLTRSTFVLCTSSGPFTVASMFNVPVLATNWISGHLLPFLPQDIVLLKTFKYKATGKLLSYEDLLKLNYGEFGYYYLQRRNIAVEDNTPAELVRATTDILERVHAKKHGVSLKTKLTSDPGRAMPHFSTATRFRGRPIISEAQFARDSIYAS